MSVTANRLTRFSHALFAVGVLLLSAEPLRWLVHSWTRTEWGSDGAYVLAGVVAIALWSVTSPRLTAPRSRRRVVVPLLLVTASVRLIGRVLDVNHIGAMALVVDVFALGLMAGLDQRRRAVSPFWLAGLFAFTLPFEAMLQRVVGHGFQQVSAVGACTVLRVAVDGATCSGLRIQLPLESVRVDLPCSGSRAVVQLFLLGCLLATLVRPTRHDAAIGVAIAAISAAIANSGRIALIAFGVAYPGRVGGIDMMAYPWHDLTGLVTLGIAFAPLLWWSGRAKSSSEAPTTAVVEGVVVSPATPARVVPALLKSVAAAAFVVCALLITRAPQHPLDIARVEPPPTLPAYLDGDLSVDVPLIAEEEKYFTRFGGGASRAAYGDRGLLLVRTSAPLRHLHDPRDCLRSLGHEVREIGRIEGDLPSSVYTSTSPDGRAYRVAVTYVSQHGEIATDVSEVVWRWIRSPGTTWTAVERIVPYRSTAAQVAAFDNAVIHALDLPHSRPSDKLKYVSSSTATSPTHQTPASGH